MAKTKVLFIAESLNIGGAEKALISILGNIDYSTCDVTLYLISRSGGFAGEPSRIEDLKYRYFVSPSRNLIGRLVNMVKIKSAYHWLPPTLFGKYICQGYDTVVAFCEGYLTKWIAAAPVNCKKIAWVHTDMEENDWPVYSGVFASVKEESDVYRKFDEVVAVSDTVARGISKKFGLKNVTTIYNMLDVDIVSKSQVKIAYTPSSRLNLVSVGRLETVKGYSALIDVVNILVNDKKLDVSLCLVGNGSQYDDLKKQVEDSSLEDRVYLAGSQENPYPYVAKSDVYVCSSLKEGFNIAVLEAMALGKPIVATASAGPIEIIDGGVYGILVENNKDALASAIESLYANDSELERLTDLSLSRVKDFDATKQIKKIQELLCP